MIDTQALQEQGRTLPLTASDNIPCLCYHCGRLYATSFLHDDTDYCSFTCAINAGEDDFIFL